MPFTLTYHLALIMHNYINLTCVLGALYISYAVYSRLSTLYSINCT